MRRTILLAILGLNLGSLALLASPILRATSMTGVHHPLIADQPLAAEADVIAFGLLSVEPIPGPGPWADQSMPGQENTQPVEMVISIYSAVCWEHAWSNVVEFFYHGSQVIAIGTMTPFSITWTHAIGRGPMGVCFVKDLTHQGHDYYVHTDHLGTPFGWFNPHTGTTTYTPFNPWGELLAISPTRGPPYATGNVDLPAGIELPTDPIFGFPPLGLSGHIYDAGTGLHQMHHRYYHPKLGHFLTPDFRAPNIWDPSTVKEPYAYAKGNPVFWADLNGLDPDSVPFRNRMGDESQEEYVKALVGFLASHEQTRTVFDHMGHAAVANTLSYRNYDPNTGLFRVIYTPQELNYQLLILSTILSNGLAEGESRAQYKHLFDELVRVAPDYMAARSGERGLVPSLHQINWDRLEPASGFTRARLRTPEEWVAEVANPRGYLKVEQRVLTTLEIASLFWPAAKGIGKAVPRMTGAMKRLTAGIPRNVRAYGVLPFGPIKSGKTGLKMFDIDRFGAFNTAARKGDDLIGHEMLQNAWLKNHGKIQNRGTGPNSRNNPAVAVDRALHQRIGAEQAKLRLNNQSVLRSMDAMENIEKNATAMRNAGVPEDVIQVLKAEAIKHANDLQ